MRSTNNFVYSLFAIFGSLVLSMMLMPAVAQAASGYASQLYIPGVVYKDEGIKIKDPATLCLTPTIKSMHAESDTEAAKEARVYHITKNSSAAVQAAYKTYTQNLQIAWSAMQQPYCGFGAFGVSAAEHSFQKSVDRVQAAFVVAMKKANAKPSTQDISVQDLNQTTIVQTTANSPKEKKSTTTKVDPDKALAEESFQIGDTGSDVTKLQTLLANDPTVIFSSTNITGYFGPLTQRALQQYRAKHSIAMAASTTLLSEIVNTTNTAPTTGAAFVMSTSTTSSTLGLSPYQEGKIPSNIHLDILNKYWLTQINVLRAKRGLRELVLDQHFIDTASEWAGYMGEHGVATHARPDGSTMQQWIDKKNLPFTVRYSPGGWQTNYFTENIAWQSVQATDASVEQGMDDTISWMLAEAKTDGPHYRTIYFPDWNSVGTGFYFAPQGDGSYKVYMAFHYGSLQLDK